MHLPDGVHEVRFAGTIWPDDSGEGQDWSESPESSVRLEVLKLNVLELRRGRHGDG